MGQIQMEPGWAGMPDGPDGVYRMGPGWLPTAQGGVWGGITTPAEAGRNTTLSSRVLIPEGSVSNLTV